ncbi:MAG: penicillin-binding protein activator [Lysobacteraceae bacterium]|nr:MAG: penicillin-binding protein activator [Xanthomonadaceae bacterium]
MLRWTARMLQRRSASRMHAAGLARSALFMLMLALGACASLPGTPGTAVVEQAGHAERLLADGEFVAAAAEFLALSRTHRGDASAYYRLRAAEALRDGGDIEAAERALGDIKRRRLHGDEPERLDLLDAEVALRRGDHERARALLTFDDATLSPELRVRALELRARAEFAAGDAFASARMRAALDRHLRGGDREHNREQIREVLATMEPAALRERFATLPENDAMRPWVEQSLRSKGHPLARTLPRPNRPVGTMRPGDGGGLAPEGYVAPRQVALLLPLAQLAGVSEPIRDGFLSAYFADAAAQRPLLRIYDAGSSPADAIAAYRRAVAEGADQVVGPLQREAVGELFRLPLEARVLALNHPDSGEVPPPGSAEFGLLPDAEGAQVAEHMLARGITRASVLIAGADWADRASRAFRTQFEAGGGSVVGEARLGDKDVDFAPAIAQASGLLGSDGNAGVFISMRPQQARLLVPQLRVAGIGAPVFATSHIYAGDANASLDRDLEGVEFCDAPWLFGSIPGRPLRAAVSGRLASANGFGGRLFAFGMDAYALLPYLDWLFANPDAYVAGATGELTADSFGRINRLVGWARFRNGMAEPVEGALSALPSR